VNISGNLSWIKFLNIAQAKLHRLSQLAMVFKNLKISSILLRENGFSMKKN
jgi:hypothetical protein